MQTTLDEYHKYKIELKKETYASGVQDPPGQHGETPSLLKKYKKISQA